MSTRPFVIIPALSAIAIAYKQSNLIADSVLPRVGVAQETFQHQKHTLEEAFSAPDTRVGRKSAPNQIGMETTLVPAATEDHGLDSPVPNSDIKVFNAAVATAGTYASTLTDPLVAATQLVQQSVQNRREKRTADLVFNRATYPVGNRILKAGNYWDDYAGSDPLVEIQDYLDSLLMRPNVLVLGRRVFTKLSMHPKVCKAVFGNNTDAGKVNQAALAAEIGLDEILIGDARINTAKPGQAATLARCWGNHAAFLYRNKQANTQAGITFGYTAQFGEKVAGTIEDPDIGLHGGQRVRSGESVKELVVAPDMGFFVENAIQNP